MLSEVANAADGTFFEKKFGVYPKNGPVFDGFLVKNGTRAGHFLKKIVFSLLTLLTKFFKKLRAELV